MRQNIIRVSATTPSKKLAGSICISSLQPEEQTILHCIGASSINQAMKACAIARGILGGQGYDLSIIPGFMNVQVGDAEVSGLKFRVEIK